METPAKYNVLMGLPLGGYVTPLALHECENSIRDCTWRHRVQLNHAGCSGGNFNSLWSMALTAALNGTHTHFCMIHADISVGPKIPFVDVLIDELETHKLDFVSTLPAIKDWRGLTSGGIGHGKTEKRWNPKRRITTHELQDLPQTFDHEDLGYPDDFLIHNNGLFVADLRNPLWFKLDADGNFPVFFEFVERVRPCEGGAKYEMESEDWAFSRRLWKAGLKSGITTAIRPIHSGTLNYETSAGFGFENGDDDTAGKNGDGWRVEGAPVWRKQEVPATKAG